MAKGIEQEFSIVVLNCGYTNPIIEKHRGQYDKIFASILLPAFARLPASQRPSIRIQGYDVVKQQYPSSLHDIDAIIISGSPNGAYEKLEWIQKLIQYVNSVYLNFPGIKIYGSCFGHQVVFEALFKDRGAVVEKDPTGWELGVHTVDLSPIFVQSFPEFLHAGSLRLQFLHGDHVRLSKNSLPDDVILIGSTTHCPVQGIYQPGRILTFQGHPEFDVFINTECLKLVGSRVGWEPEFTEAAVASAKRRDDADIASDVIVAFFLRQ